MSPPVTTRNTTKISTWNVDFLILRQQEIKSHVSRLGSQISSLMTQTLEAKKGAVSNIETAPFSLVS